MDTPQKTITAQIGTPISKSRFELSQDSPVFNYINSLSPIRPVKSIQNPDQLSTLNFTSPPSVFTSPHLTSSHKESRFFKTHNSSSSSCDPTIPVEDSRHESTSNEQVSATKDFNIDASLGKEASIEMEQPQIVKYDGSETNPDDPVAASLCGRDTTHLSLVPYASPHSGENAPGMEMYDNVEGKTETPDWGSLITDASELLIFGSPNDSEAFRCLMMQRSSTSQAPPGMPKKEPESLNAIPYESV